jgi:hypothetical protein
MENGTYLLNIQKDFTKDPNYQGISVLNTMIWLYERILSNLIEKEYSNLEEEEQSGF